jgi:quinol monooxygenase YgiN
MGRIVYEVNVDVEAARADEFEAWLHPHVDEMLKFDGFDRATVHARESLDEGSGERHGFTVHYAVRDRQALDAYFRDHAAAMRGDGATRFGDSFRAWRNILTPRENA